MSLFISTIFLYKQSKQTFKSQQHTSWFWTPITVNRENCQMCLQLSWRFLLLITAWNYWYLTITLTVNHLVCPLSQFYMLPPTGWTIQTNFTMTFQNGEHQQSGVRNSHEQHKRSSSVPVIKLWCDLWPIFTGNQICCNQSIKLHSMSLAYKVLQSFTTLYIKLKPRLHNRTYHLLVLKYTSLELLSE